MTPDPEALMAMARAAPHQRGWKLFGSAGQKLLSIFTASGKQDLVHWTEFDSSRVAKSWPERERLARHIATFDPPTVIALLADLKTWSAQSTKDVKS